MKDDSLSDVAFCNTKGGIHARAKELSIKAYSLGCSCSDCNKEFDKINDSVGKQEADPLLAKHETALNVYAKQIWNEAIEAAYNKADRYSYEAGQEIRKLKK